MTLIAMMLASIFWYATLIPAMGLTFGTMMMTDAGGRDKVEDCLVMSLIVTAVLYLVVTAIAIILGWIAYLVDKDDIARYFMLSPVVIIGLYCFGFILVMIRQPAWRPW